MSRVHDMNLTEMKNSEEFLKEFRSIVKRRCMLHLPLSTVIMRLLNDSGFDSIEGIHRRLIVHRNIHNEYMD